MKSLSPALAASILALGATSARAAPVTFEYAASPYVSVTNYESCPAGSCRDFTTAMTIHGTLTFDGLISGSSVNLYPYLTDFLLTDGVTTYSRGDPQVQVMTMNGNVGPGGIPNHVTMRIIRWQSGAPPHANGDRLDTLFADGVTSHNGVCTTISSMYSEPDGCSAWRFSTSTGGSFATEYSSTTRLPIVPTLGGWAMIGLATLLAGVGVVTNERRPRGVV